LLTCNEARRIAANIAKLASLLRLKKDLSAMLFAPRLALLCLTQGLPFSFGCCCLGFEKGRAASNSEAVAVEHQQRESL
jgi:hypothetical protein